MVDDPGHWVWHRHLGNGAFGVVQLWRNDSTDEFIAIKKCKNDNERLTQRQKERWINEVQTMNSIRHPNIVATRRVPAQLSKLQDPLPVLCMEYCTRGDLRSILNRSSNCCGIQEQEAFRIMLDVASAVEYLHSRNFTHRDLKPENIVAQSYNDQVMVYKITDLGYVCELGEDTVSHSVVGTLTYLAPELLWKSGYTCSVDYWSLGIMFYEIITGNRPFFPDMQVTANWIEQIKTKTDEQICTREKEDQEIFSEEIAKPTTISDCMSDEMTAWFRIALKWDPKTRGKVKNDTGVDELVIFDRLKPLKFTRVIHVFVVSLYRKDSYAVSLNITVKELQNLIRQKTGIEENQQILSDFKSNILSNPSSLLYACIEDSRLILCQKDGIYVKDVPSPKMSPPLQRMLASGKKLLRQVVLKRYYSAVVFFISQELELFHSYIIALSVSIDLSFISVSNLKGIAKSLSKSSEALSNELRTLIGSPEYQKFGSELKTSLDTTISKTQNLIDGMEKLSLNIVDLARQIEQLKHFSNIDWLESWRSKHEQATRNLEKITTVDHMQPIFPTEMIKILFEALKLQKEQLQSQKIGLFIKQINEFNEKMVQVRVALMSFESLIDRYRETYKEIVTKGTEEIRQQESICPPQLNFTNSMDAMIYDNIFLSNMIKSLIAEDMADLEI